jgi:nitrogen-specific signal transduction histidine kinase
LAVAQEIVTRNGGLIEFDSEPGRTVFSVLLPLGGPTGLVAVGVENPPVELA